MNPMRIRFMTRAAMAGVVVVLGFGVVGFQDLESWFLQMFYPQLLSSPRESQSAAEQREFIAYQDQMTPVANAVRNRLVRALQHSHNNWDGFYSSGEGY